MFGFDLKNFHKFGGAVSGIGTPYKRLGGLQQIAELGKPDRFEFPQALRGKPRNGFKRVVFSPVRVASQILKLLQL